MRIKADDLVLVTASVFPEKVGKVGIVTDVSPGLENPYEVEVVGGTTSRFPDGCLRPVSAIEVARLYNAPRP